MKELGFPHEESKIMRCDSHVTIHIISNLIFHEGMNHIKVDCDFLRDDIMSKKMCNAFIVLANQLANIFTKSLRVYTSILYDKLGMIDIYTPTSNKVSEYK